MDQTIRVCPNCRSTSFADGRCLRCRRPVHPDADYFDTLEEIAWEIVNATYDEYGEDLRGTAHSGPNLQRVIVELANSLRHYHHDGDGCLDEEWRGN